MRTIRSVWQAAMLCAAVVAGGCSPETEAAPGPDPEARNHPERFVLIGETTHRKAWAPPGDVPDANHAVKILFDNGLDRTVVVRLSATARFELPSGAWTVVRTYPGDSNLDIREVDGTVIDRVTAKREHGHDYACNPGGAWDYVLTQGSYAKGDAPGAGRYEETVRGSVFFEATLDCVFEPLPESLTVTRYTGHEARAIRWSIDHARAEPDRSRKIHYVRSADGAERRITVFENHAVVQRLDRAGRPRQATDVLTARDETVSVYVEDIAVGTVAKDDVLTILYADEGFRVHAVSPSGRRSEAGGKSGLPTNWFAGSE